MAKQLLITSKLKSRAFYYWTFYYYQSIKKRSLAKNVKKIQAFDHLNYGLQWLKSLENEKLRKYSVIKIQ